MNVNSVLLSTSVTDIFWITSVQATKLVATHCTSLQEAMCMSETFVVSL